MNLGASADTLTIGDQAATITFWNETRIEATLPLLDPRTYNLKVRVNEEHYADTR